MIALRTAYVEHFATLPHVQVSEAHDGQFGPDEVARLGGARTPAVYVACMGLVEAYEDGGPPAALLRWVAMILARPEDAVRTVQVSPGDVAARIALRIAYELSEHSFAASIERARGVRARNLFGAQPAQRGYRLWGVEWQAPARITPDDLSPVLHPFLTLITDFDLPEGADVDLTARVDLEHDDRPEPEP